MPMMHNTKTSVRPEGISDLDILWAIRDIPRSHLDIKLKAVLSMLLAIIGNNHAQWYYHSHEDLAEKIGCSSRRLPAYLDSLEKMGFILIKKPARYIKGDSNEYKLNYKTILSTAKKSREQRLGRQTVRHEI